jgi:hypothetical protein
MPRGPRGEKRPADVKNLGSEFVSMDHEAKASRIAVGLLEVTFNRLRNIRSADDEPSAGGG